MRGPYRKMPTQAHLKSLFHYDPETGLFTRACTRRRWKAGQIAGTVAGGYISINVDRTVYRAHRLAWVYMTGAEPKAGIDHINGDPLDNRWANLREATQQENLMNKCVQSNNKFGVKGVYKHTINNTFVARIAKNGVQKHLGCYATAEEAKAAYDAAALVLHGEFARS